MNLLSLILFHRTICLVKNAGISEARNAGMKKAVGKYITFVDADDYLTKNPIYEKAINILEKENVEVVTWLWQYEQQGKYVVSKKKINNIPYGKISGKVFLIYCIKEIMLMEWLWGYGINYINENWLKMSISNIDITKMMIGVFVCYLKFLGYIV